MFLGVSAGAPRGLQRRLIMAFQIDDLITLDPAEVFEFTGAEYAANVYDRPGHLPAGRLSRTCAATSPRAGRSPTTARPTPSRCATASPSTAATRSPPRTPPGRCSPRDQAEQDARLHPDPVRLHARERRRPHPGGRRAHLHGRAGQALRADLLPLLPDRDASARWSTSSWPWSTSRTATSATPGCGPPPPAPARSSCAPGSRTRSLVVDGNPEYWGGAPGFERVVSRHIPEPATQMLLLEKGDIDIARNLEADQLERLRGNPEIIVREVPKGAIYYLGLNQKNEYLAKPEVREALKWLVDYDGIASTIVKGSAVVHQSFLPRGFLGAIDDKPYHARRRQGQGAAGAGRPRGRLQGDHGHAQHLAAAGDRAGPAGELGPRPGSSSRSCPATTSRRSPSTARAPTTSTSAAGARTTRTRTPTPTPSRPTRTTRTGRPIPASSPGATPGRSRR